MSRSLKPGSMKIINALMDGKPESFTELRKKTGLSAPALSDYLKKLTKAGYIIKESDTGHYKIPLGRFTMEIPLKTFELLEEEDLQRPSILLTALYRIQKGHMEMLRFYLKDLESINKLNSDVYAFFEEYLYFCSLVTVYALRSGLNLSVDERYYDMKKFFDEYIVPLNMYTLTVLSITPEISEGIMEELWVRLIDKIRLLQIEKESFVKALEKDREILSGETPEEC